jgi:hypothetical protein
MTYTERELIIESAAQSLYNLGTTKYPKPKKTLKLDLIKLVGLLGGNIYELTQLRDLDPDTPTIETHEDGTFTLTVINYSPWQVCGVDTKKSFTHRLACLLGTYLTHHRGKPAGIHETHHERKNNRHTPQALDGLHFARCLMLPRHQLLTEWARTWKTDMGWKLDLADTFGIDIMWLEVRARQLNLLHLDGTTTKTPTPPLTSPEPEHTQQAGAKEMGGALAILEAKGKTGKEEN